jgi:catechol 2,3-dioxygenase-like lactoylglutathione lyase family enzyme
MRHDAAVIAGVHALLYADDAEAARAFLRDVLGLDSVPAHEGWLIFALPPAELGVHPTQGNDRRPGEHQLWLMCHDIHRTAADLEARGVELASPISDEGFGLITSIAVPGAGEIGLYQPKHASPLQGFG